MMSGIGGFSNFARNFHVNIKHDAKIQNTNKSEISSSTSPVPSFNEVLGYKVDEDGYFTSEFNEAAGIPKDYKIHSDTLKSLVNVNDKAIVFNKMFSSKKDEKSIYTRETLKKELKEGTILFKWCLIVLTVFFLIMYLVQNNITEIKEHWKDPLLLVLPFYTILIIIRIIELIDYYIKLWKIIKLEKKENY